MVGVRGRVRRGRHAFEASFGQGLITGDVNHWARIRDTANSGEVTRTDWLQEERAGIPVSQLRLAWEWNILSHLSVGMGVNSWAWWDTPLAPVRSPGQDLPSPRHKTLVMGGVMFAFAWQY
jgi:hypothetical protein